MPLPSPSGVLRDRTALHIAGLRVFHAELDDAVQALWDDIAADDPHVFALVNGHSASLRADSADYAAVLEDPRVVGLPDGFAITLGARLVGGGHVGRTPGPDLFASACARAAADGTRFFLLGGREGVAESLRARLQEEQPDLIVSGVATPPFGVWPDEVSRSLASQVRESGAQVLWLGVSAPKQEVWALKYLKDTGVPTVCVGAAFDFFSGSTRRAPAWMRRSGLEWLYRLLVEPRRLWRRYLIGNARFVADLIRYGSGQP